MYYSTPGGPTEVNRARRRARGRDSVLVAQVEEVIVANGLNPSAVANSAGVSPKSLKSWLAGSLEPTLHSVERILTAIGYVAVLVPVGEAVPGTNLRDVLVGADRSVYEAQSGDAHDALDNTLRLVQMRQIENERLYAQGVIDLERYTAEFHQIILSLRRVVDTATRLRGVSGADQWGDDVEVVYGSERGSGYHDYQKRVARAEEGRKELAQAPAKALPPGKAG